MVYIEGTFILVKVFQVWVTGFCRLEEEVRENLNTNSFTVDRHSPVMTTSDERERVCKDSGGDVLDCFSLLFAPLGNSGLHAEVAYIMTVRNSMYKVSLMQDPT